LESVKVRVGGAGSWAKSVFPAEFVERRVFELKGRLAWLVARCRDSRVVEAASELLVHLTELLEDLEEGVEPLVVLGRLSVLEAEVLGLLARPEVVVES